MCHLLADSDNTIINKATVSAILCLHQLTINPILLRQFGAEPITRWGRLLLHHELLNPISTWAGEV